MVLHLLGRLIHRGNLHILGSCRQYFKPVRCRLLVFGSLRIGVYSMIGIYGVHRWIPPPHSNVQVFNIWSDFLHGDGWIEDKICACRDLSFCYNRLNMPAHELSALFKSFELDTPRAETCCAIGAFYFAFSLYEKAIFWYKLALNLKPNYSSGAFVFCDAYNFLPAISLCVCYDRLHDLKKAKFYNDLAGTFKPYDKNYLANKLYFEKIEGHL